MDGSFGFEMFFMGRSIRSQGPVPFAECGPLHHLREKHRLIGKLVLGYEAPEFVG